MARESRRRAPDDLALGLHFPAGARTGGFDDLDGALLIRCEPWWAGAAAELAGGGGLVLRGPHSPAAARTLRANGFAGPVLCDAERYRRPPGSGPDDALWAQRQRALGLPVLTDAGYLEATDATGLREELARAVAMGEDVIACLPLAPAWLSTGLAELERLLDGHPQPVALVLEPPRGPAAARQLVRGLLRLLALEVPLLLLSDDVSPVGALSFGALAGAVGIPGGRELLLGHTLSWHHEEDVAAAARRTPDDEWLWHCPCEVCADTRLDRFAGGGRAPVEVLRHSTAALALLRDELFQPHFTAAQRRANWVERCSAAGFHHEVLRRELGRGWQVPACLGAWREVGSTHQRPTG